MVKKTFKKLNISSRQNISTKILKICDLDKIDLDLNLRSSARLCYSHNNSQQKGYFHSKIKNTKKPLRP